MLSTSHLVSIVVYVVSFKYDVNGEDTKTERDNVPIETWNVDLNIHQNESEIMKSYTNTLLPFDRNINNSLPVDVIGTFYTDLTVFYKFKNVANVFSCTFKTTLSFTHV